MCLRVDRKQTKKTPSLHTSILFQPYFLFRPDGCRLAVAREMTATNMLPTRNFTTIHENDSAFVCEHTSLVTTPWCIRMGFLHPGTTKMPVLPSLSSTRARRPMDNFLDFLRPKINSSTSNPTFAIVASVSAVYTREKQNVLI